MTVLGSFPAGRHIKPGRLRLVSTVEYSMVYTMVVQKSVRVNEKSGVFLEVPWYHGIFHRVNGPLATFCTGNIGVRHSRPSHNTSRKCQSGGGGGGGGAANSFSNARGHALAVSSVDLFLMSISKFSPLSHKTSD
jgi:hypothetical protein